MPKYVKMYKDGTWEKIQEDRVERFLEVGYTLEPTSEKKSPAKGSKNKITADAQVTSTQSEEEDWDSMTDEDWADSIESVSVPSNGEISDSEDELPKEED